MLVCCVYEHVSNFPVLAWLVPGCLATHTVRRATLGPGGRPCPFIAPNKCASACFWHNLILSRVWTRLELMQRLMHDCMDGVGYACDGKDLIGTWAQGNYLILCFRAGVVKCALQIWPLLWYCLGTLVSSLGVGWAGSNQGIRSTWRGGWERSAPSMVSGQHSPQLATVPQYCPTKPYHAFLVLKARTLQPMHFNGTCKEQLDILKFVPVNGKAVTLKMHLAENTC